MRYMRYEIQYMYLRRHRERKTHVEKITPRTHGSKKKDSLKEGARIHSRFAKGLKEGYLLTTAVVEIITSLVPAEAPPELPIHSHFS